MSLIGAGSLISPRRFCSQRGGPSFPWIHTVMIRFLVCLRGLTPRHPGSSFWSRIRIQETNTGRDCSMFTSGKKRGFIGGSAVVKLRQGSSEKPSPRWAALRSPLVRTRKCYSSLFLKWHCPDVRFPPVSEAACKVGGRMNRVCGDVFSRGVFKQEN